MVKVQVKWNKEKIDLEMDVSGPLLQFKNQIAQITNIPIDKQKIIYKGTVLNDDHILSNLKIQNGAVLMLMGQAEPSKLSQQLENKTVFIEDLTPQDRAKILKEKEGIVLPAGLKNLGNTCYLNSSLQCLRKINEFKDFIISKPASNSATPDGVIVNALQALFKQLETSGDSVVPENFVEMFMNVFPQFAEGYKNGVFQQQDADEAFQTLLQTLESQLQTQDQEGDSINLLNQLFEIKYETKLKNLENEVEPESVKTESMRKLLCIIDNQSKPVDNISEGIKAALEGQIQKYSDVAKKDQIYSKIQKISKLPNYLLIQEVRFFWKQESAIAGTHATKAKILRNVAFPKILDIYDFCTDKLKEQLDEGKKYEKKKLEEMLQQDTDKFELYKKKLESEGVMLPEDTRQIYKQFKDAQVEEDIKEHDRKLYSQHGLGLETGNYQLIGLITHKGRTADSGHYVGWVHFSGEQWYKYDDDVVSVVKTEDILNLRGGGDHHMSYYLLYRKLEII